MNQRLPSGPAVIPMDFAAKSVEMGNSVMAWVVGLISPISPMPPSVNQRLPSGPAVIMSGTRIGGGDRELGDDVGRRVDHPDLVGACSVNQRLPSGPAVIPLGSSCAVGVGNSVMAWVVGLISPILPISERSARLGEPEVAVRARRDHLTGSELAVGTRELGDGVGRRVDHRRSGWRLYSVNQRLPSGPAVIPIGIGIGSGSGEFGDRKQATIFQPFEPRAELMAPAGLVPKAIQGKSLMEVSFQGDIVQGRSAIRSGLIAFRCARTERTGDTGLAGRPLCRAVPPVVYDPAATGSTPDGGAFRVHQLVGRVVGTWLSEGSARDGANTSAGRLARPSRADASSRNRQGSSLSHPVFSIVSTARLYRIIA